MIWLFVTLGVILIFLLYLLFAPFYLEMDSRKGLCRLRWHKIGQAQVRLTENSLMLETKIVGWHKEIDLLLRTTRKSRSTQNKKRRSLSWGKTKGLIASFKIKKLDIRLSFDDMPLNGILYPACFLLSQTTGRNIVINFWGENEIALEIENNFYRLIRAYIKS